MYKPRDYQVTLIRAIFEHFQKYRRVMAQLPTGGGKTVILSAIAHEFVSRGESVLVVAHRQELLYQAQEKLQSVTGTKVGLVKSGIKPDYNAKIQVVGVQSFKSRKKHITAPQLVIVDEAHHSTASSYKAIFEAYPNAYVLGLTATPIRTDGKGFRGIFEAIVTGPGTDDLITMGHLSNYRLFADPQPMITKDAKKTRGDYSVSDLERANNAKVLSGNLVASYKKYAWGKLCIVFAISREHGREIANSYNRHGIPAIFVDGETPNGERQKAIEDFSNRKYWIMVNVGLFGEGVDIPVLEAVQCARPTMSLALWLQMLGRGLRLAPGKEYAIMLDHTENWDTHGLPCQPRIWTLDGSKKKRTSKIVKTKEGEVIRKDVATPVLFESETELKEIHIDEQMRWKRAWKNMVDMQIEGNYKPWWLFFNLRKKKAPLAVWRALAEYVGQTPTWAEEQYNYYTVKCNYAVKEL